MSYNGIGLKSAKGSATSGHIQKSLADNDSTKNKNYHARQRAKDKLKNVGKGKLADNDSEPIKRYVPLEARRKIIKHLSKREIEVQVSELRDTLEDSNEDHQVIEKRCEELRTELLQEWEARQRLDKLYTSRAKRNVEESNETRPHQAD
ncbi:hypothetical protein HG535_0C01320 [Zygotorulaspora mrakii]|uniref:Pre-mRNA-splicing factor CWC21 n=1 Tax=Zygotorulaspora mrakii TaxID=42260 RepID=A0A7H9AZX4_ZYGMR|nr:uncharacterized protein HG535_0C01320 [Zygotorulaspora mrakii]QLG71783.1 hypothetical protein HG535_0C01320 [Zygotorulaspora mrakii]